MVIPGGIGDVGSPRIKAAVLEERLSDWIVKSTEE